LLLKELHLDCGESPLLLLLYCLQQPVNESRPRGVRLMSTKQNRRQFMQTTAVGASALTLTAASYNRVLGAGDRVRVGFLGVGGRCQQHIDVILQMQKENKGVEPAAVCDVWDGEVVPGLIKGRGLYPSAERCGIKDDGKHVTKYYEKVLELNDVDVIVVAT